MKTIKTLNQITKLKFDLPKYNVVDWFIVHLYSDGCLIRSGLRNADETIKSPFFYEKSFWGKDWKKKALKDFNEFLKGVNI